MMIDSYGTILDNNECVWCQACTQLPAAAISTTVHELLIAWIQWNFS